MSGEQPDKPSVPWPEDVAMFKTTGAPKHVVFFIPMARLVAPNTTLEQDKATVLAFGPVEVKTRIGLGRGERERRTRRGEFGSWLVRASTCLVRRGLRLRMGR